MTYTTTENAKSRLATRNLTLPDLGAPAYSYDAWTRHDDVLYMSGQISRTPNGEVLDGRAGVDATTADAAAAAEVAALNLLARIEQAVGLDNVEQILKLNVWIASGPDYTDQPVVAETASQLLIDVLGRAGRHARTTLPTHVLPKNALVELEAVVAVKK
ncbi:YjgF translation initiation inhibitor [Rhodococcus sp. 05-2256-B2]|uniref:RidA family protein n=1 Tax=unclassified Rhodococcus (in: high G+C Gram-positive bacteria) TaxID=192944 RepID=UPI000B9B5E36|nr:MULTISPECIES: RidA family protein [unclassified Rhodococcus (in: high G+C Gram-positive bacteria)]OZD87620.1 YjgF translation initiation inhibitor [Rhodococcus sp. 05-2256-B4]OZD89885.1 YjgF translation initiation inhibitor [Rhodococcus sp. 05-2256-B2]OZD92203.1 YjgF translation initiation inhibitor [Rhodococcus sp. 05-2256-B3]OZD98908.1 YjgF translation initiation inhibitor [Rhodococcus sp. 05-2256-B1]